MNTRLLLSICFYMLGLLSLSSQHSLFLQNKRIIFSSSQIEETWNIFDEVVANDTLYSEEIPCILFFDHIPDREIIHSWKKDGIHLYEYLPKNAYVGGIRRTLSKEYLKQQGIKGIYLLQVEDKISRNLLSESDMNRCTDKDMVRCWIHTYPRPGIDALKKQLLDWASENGKMLKIGESVRELYALDVWVNRVDISSIASLKYVKFIDAAPLPGTNENDQAKTSIRSNSLQQGWNGGLNLDGSGIKLMMNDDGDIGNHIDYKNRIDQTEATASPSFVDHANHIAGTLVGRGNRDPRYAGIAPGAFLKVHTYTTDPGSGQALFDFPNAYVNEQITITSTSQSDGCNGGYSSFAQLMDHQIRDHPSLMHVFSAGNSGNYNCGYGAGNGWGTITGGHKQAKNVIAVGNVTKDDLLVGSSSRGPAADGRIKPECVAVGTNVISTTDFPEENSYVMKSGTSHACPGVAGTLAILYQGYKNLHGNNLPSSALMKAALLNTCDDLGNPGPDFRFGFGRVNARRAFQIIENNNFIEDSIDQGQQWDTSLVVPSGTHELRVMLYWNDVPASVLSQYALVNNLDAELTDPTMQTYLPWVLNSTPDATLLNQPATRQVDTLNNIEQITVLNPVAGTWHLRVYGTLIPFGKQPFVIVYEMLQPQLLLTYPNGSEKLVPGEIERIRWDAYGNNSNDFQLSYSTDGGNNWQMIQSNIPNTQRHYDWQVPSTVSGQYLVKVEWGVFSDTSDNFFSVMPTADSLRVDTICDNKILLNWPDVPDATGYIIYRLGNIGMDSLTYTTESEQWVTIIGTPEDNWFSVAALGANGAISRRAYAISGNQFTEDCNTGIIQNKAELQPEVFPVPASTELYIRWSKELSENEVYISIYEISGRCVLIHNYPVSEQMIRINISHLNNGVYLLSAKQEEGVYICRFIKQ